MTLNFNINKEEFFWSLYKDKIDDPDFDDEKDIHQRVDSFMNQGFIYIEPGLFSKPKENDNRLFDKRSYVLTPSGRKLDLPKIYRTLRRLKIGNPHQLEVIKAWECFMLSEIYYDGV